MWSTQRDNSVVILDKDDYKRKIEELLENRQYLKIKKYPLTKCKTSFRNVLKNLKVILDIYI